MDDFADGHFADTIITLGGGIVSGLPAYSAKTIASRLNMDMPLLSGPPVSLASAESKDVLLYRSE